MIGATTYFVATRYIRNKRSSNKSNLTGEDSCEDDMISEDEDDLNYRLSNDRKRRGLRNRGFERPPPLITFCELFEQVDVASMNDARQPFQLDDAAVATALASRVAAFVQRFDDGYASRQTTPYVSNYRPLVPTATREAHERSAEPGCCYGARTSAG